MGQWLVPIAVALGGILLFLVLLLLRARRRMYAVRAEDGKRRAHIVIVGGGFGGVYTAQHLEQLITGRDDFEITLVNQENYLVFQPMLPDVISGQVGVVDTVAP